MSDKDWVKATLGVPTRTWGPELAAALAKAQGRVSMVAKDAKNSFHNYKYASAESLIEEARGALSPCGLSVLEMGSHVEPEEHEIVLNDKGKPVARVIGRLHVEYLLMHDSGQYMTLKRSTPVILEAGKPEDKAEATASTYTLGYTLRGLLLLSRGEEGPDARDDRDHEPAPRRMTTDDRPTPTETHFQAMIASAASLGELEIITGQIRGAGVAGVGRERLVAAYRARKDALAAIAAGADPGTGEIPPAAPSAPASPPPAPVEQDWGDRAAVIAGLLGSAKTGRQLEELAEELRDAVEQGMPAELAEPLHAQLATLTKRAPRNGEARP